MKVNSVNSDQGQSMSIRWIRIDLMIKRLVMAFRNTRVNGLICTDPNPGMGRHTDPLGSKWHHLAGSL